MIILKIGGGNTINLEGIALDVAERWRDEKIIIVHGANGLRDSLAEQLQKPRKTVTSVSGYTSVYSDEDTIDLQMMAYAGLRNKRIVELLQRSGVNAMGLCGLDGGVIRGKRNVGIRVRESGKMKMLRDFSGKPKSINKELLDVLLGQGILPVLTVPIMDEHGTAVNSENDDIVAVLQQAFGAERVIHLMEAPGFLEDASDPSTLIPRLPQSQLVQWEEKARGRIKRKLLAVKRLFENGVQKVIIADGRTSRPVTEALNDRGTVLQ